MSTPTYSIGNQSWIDTHRMREDGSVSICNWKDFGIEEVTPGDDEAEWREACNRLIYGLKVKLERLGLKEVEHKSV